jgi:hypothetical protein
MDASSAWPQIESSRERINLSGESLAHSADINLPRCDSLVSILAFFEASSTL